VNESKHKPYAILTFALLGAVVAGFLCLACDDSTEDKPAATTSTEPLVAIFKLPEFSLTERSRKTVTLDDFKGRVWIANFIFTSCGGPCPIMTQHMAELQEDFRDEERLCLVTITVDPETDNPEKLRDYAGRFNADKDKWFFLTGEREAISKLSIEGFKLAAPRQAEGEDDPSHPIVHSTRFVLVDNDAGILGYYDGTDETKLADLRRDIKRLLADGRENEAFGD
jgi:protein SCO1/2